jgi:hypothetical protein
LKLTKRRLPEIQHELQAVLHKTDLELSSLPKPPSNDPVGEVHELLGAFNRTVSSNVQGTARADGLVQRINKLHDSFRVAIRRTAPDFRPYDKDRADPPAMPSPDFLGVENDGLDNSQVEPMYIDEVCQRLEQ